MNTARTHPGPEKIILKADSNTLVRVRCGVNVSQASGRRLHGDATYIIAGGLGDIGRILCELIASLGAGEIVILSRRTLKLQEKGHLQEKVHSVSPKANLHVLPCDISLLDDVVRAAQTLRDLRLPPVRGVIQAATVLDVSTPTPAWR